MIRWQIEEHEERLEQAAMKRMDTKIDKMLKCSVFFMEFNKNV